MSTLTTLETQIESATTDLQKLITMMIEADYKLEPESILVSMAIANVIERHYPAVSAACDWSRDDRTMGQVYAHASAVIA